MDLEHRLQTLVDGARFDVSGYSPGRGTPYGHRCPSQFIYEASLPGGRPVSLFKVLLTNSCTNDCAYCANQVGRDVRRTSFRPEELARVFMELYTRKRVQGLFLTSGIS
jgi:predicted DNA-binding helix-hairpin-helix protein